MGGRCYERQGRRRTALRGGPNGRTGRQPGIARRYLQALERGETGAALSKFFAPDVAFEEFPNRLTPLGKKRGLAAALAAAEPGKKAMSNQMYKITDEIAERERVALEVEWVGTLAVPFGCFRTAVR
jgi:SnoaL-like protein